MCSLDILVEGAVTKNLLQYLNYIGWTKKHPKSGTKSSAITKVPYNMPLTLGEKVNFLPLTEPSPINNLGYVKVSQHTDDEKCD
jgi:hypothetical protein